MHQESPALVAGQFLFRWTTRGTLNYIVCTCMCVSGGGWRCVYEVCSPRISLHLTPAFSRLNLDFLKPQACLSSASHLCLPIGIRYGSRSSIVLTWGTPQLTKSPGIQVLSVWHTVSSHTTSSQVGLFQPLCLHSSQ